MLFCLLCCECYFGFASVGKECQGQEVEDRTEGLYLPTAPCSQCEATLVFQRCQVTPEIFSTHFQLNFSKKVLKFFIHENNTPCLDALKNEKKKPKPKEFQSARQMQIQINLCRQSC